MSKARTVLKVSSAGAATAIYALSARAAAKGEMSPVKPSDWRKVVIAAGLMTALTWIAALA